MLVLTKKSFAGVNISAPANVKMDIPEGALLNDLLKCGFVVPVEDKLTKAKPKKTAKGEGNA